MGYYISVQSLPRNFTAKMMMIIVLLALTDFEENPQKPKSEKKKKHSIASLIYFGQGLRSITRLAIFK